MSRKVETAQMPSRWWTDKQNVVHPHNGMLFNPKKEWSSDTCYNVDEPWKHKAKWQKQDTKCHISYDSLIWNVWNRQIYTDMETHWLPGNRREGMVGGWWLNGEEYLLFLIFFNWSIVGLQCHVSFRCTAKWFHYIYIFFFRLFSLIGHHKILSIVPCAVQ